MEQDQLFDAGEHKPKAYLDYKYLPQNVFPTTVRKLGQASDILEIREADLAKGITPAQHRMFTSTVRNTSHPDAAGTATVLVTTGIPTVTKARSMYVYDHMSLGEAPKLVPCTDEDVARFIQQWFFARQGRR